MPRKTNASPAVIKITVTKDMKRRTERAAMRMSLDVASYAKVALSEKLERDGMAAPKNGD